MSDIIEAAARALRKLETDLIWWDSESELRQFATTFLTAVTPLIRAAALEEAAKEAEKYKLAEDFTATEIATAIRALKEQP